MQKITGDIMRHGEGCFPGDDPAEMWEQAMRLRLSAFTASEHEQRVRLMDLADRLTDRAKAVTLQQMSCQDAD